MVSRAPVITAVLGQGVVPPTSPVVTADDLGLTRGDGCFDATVARLGGGRAHANLLAPHLDRFGRSAARLGLPLDRPAWEALIDEALAAWERGGPEGEASLKVMLTGGPESADPASVTGILTLTPVGDGLARAREGVTAVTLAKNVSTAGYADAPWLLGTVKTLSYALNRAAYREAERRGVQEAVWTSIEGHVLEAPTSTVVVRRGRTLLTPDPAAGGTLDSVTQAELWSAAADLGFEARYGVLTSSDLLAAEGVWLLSAVRGVVPVLELDGHPVAQDPQSTAAFRRATGF